MADVPRVTKAERAEALRIARKEREGVDAERAFEIALGSDGFDRDPEDRPFPTDAEREILADAALFGR